MPDTFTNWLTFTPATQVGYRRAYIDLPAFSYTGLSWAGGSECVAQFNFSASQNFILLNRPTKPTNVNYGLCIRYRVGDTVYRYKLWTDTNFVLNDDVAPLYNGQIIKKNFVLEVWNLNGQTTASQTTAIRMISSVRSVPTDITVSSDYALATGTEFTSFDNFNPTLPSGAIHRWTSFATSAGLTDVIGGVVLVEQGPDIAPVEYVAADSTWLRGRAKFPNAANVLRGRLLGETLTDTTIYVVGSFTPFDAFLNKRFLAFASAPSTLAYANMLAGNTNQIRAGDTGAGYFDLTIPNEDPHIIRLSVDQGSSVSGRIDTGTSGNDTSVEPAVSNPYLYVGGYDVSISNECNIAEVIIFNSAFTSGDTNDLAVMQYLRWYHFGEMPLPLTFDSGGAWLDNV